ncbi:MAG: extracellular solute-binding protein, partial [Clostridia bacterium]
MKKILALVLALAMTASMVSFAAAEDATHLSLFISGDGERLNDKNPMHAFLLEKSNVYLDIQIPIGDEQEKLNMILVGGEYPDMIRHQNATIMSTMIAEGIALPLEDLIEQYAPNVKEAFGDSYKYLFNEDGHIYSLPSGFGQSAYSADVIPATWSGWTFNIREDMYQALGSPEIKTLDDVYAVLAKMKEVQEKNIQGSDYYPLGGFVQSWQNMLETLIQSAGGYNGRFYIDDAQQLSYWVRAPWAMEIVKWYNKVYREGLLDPEAFTMDRKTFGAQKIGGDQIKSYFGIHYYVNSQIPSLNALGVENGYWQNFPVSVAEIGQRPNLVSESRMGGGYLVITDKLKDDPEKLEAAMRLLHAMADPYNNFVVINGIEGINWEFDADGKPVLTQAYLDRAADSSLTTAEVINYNVSGADTFGSIFTKTLGTSPWGTYMALKDDPANTGDQRTLERQTRLIGYDYDTTFFAGMNAKATDDLLYSLGNIDKT